MGDTLGSDEEGELELGLDEELVEAQVRALGDELEGPAMGSKNSSSSTRLPPELSMS